MCKMGLAFGTASEDMDALTFGSSFLMRGFNSKKEPITQIDLTKLLEGFEMNMDEFIDLCILCGCDYTHSIGGIGPIKAFNMMKEHGKIEGVLEAIKTMNEDPNKKQKFIIPENFLFEESRELFKTPDAIAEKEELEPKLKWEAVDQEGMRAFLVTEKEFGETRVENGIKKLASCKGKTNQGRLDSFFKSAGVSSSSTTHTKKGTAVKGGAKNVGTKRAQSFGGRGKR